MWSPQNTESRIHTALSYGTRQYGSYNIKLNVLTNHVDSSRYPWRYVIMSARGSWSDFSGIQLETRWFPRSKWHLDRWNELQQPVNLRFDPLLNWSWFCWQVHRSSSKPSSEDGFLGILECTTCWWVSFSLTFTASALMSLSDLANWIWLCEDIRDTVLRQHNFDNKQNYLADM